MPRAAGSRPKPKPKPTGPPANAGARVGRGLDNLGRQAAAAPVVSGSQRAAVRGGSVAVGFIVYAIGLNYMQAGWPGVTAWLKAKLMNKTAQPPAAVPALLFHTGTRTGPAGGTMTTSTQPTPPTTTGGTLYA